MARAFPNLTARERAALDDRGIDIERSFRDFLQELTGRSYDDVEEMISVGARWMLGAEELRKPIRSLTPPEREVLRLRALGYTTEQIASLRGRSVHTIKTQTKTLVAALNARNSTHALLIALATRQL